MTAPANLECSLVRDLLIPYVAAEVQPQTLAFINSHLSGCEACRGALAQLNGGLAQPVAPPLPADAGRRVVSRVRRNVFVLIAVVVLALGASVGSLWFAVRTVVNLAGMNVVHIVPPDRKKIADVADRVDLTPAGLRLVSHGSGPLGDEYGYVGGYHDLKRAGVLFAHGLSGVKARIKLMVALGAARHPTELRRWFAN